MVWDDRNDPSGGRTQVSFRFGRFLAKNRIWKAIIITPCASCNALEKKRLYLQCEPDPYYTLRPLAVASPIRQQHPWHPIRPPEDHVRQHLKRTQHPQQQCRSRLSFAHPRNSASPFTTTSSPHLGHHTPTRPCISAANVPIQNQLYSCRLIRPEGLKHYLQYLQAEQKTLEQQRQACPNCAAARSAWARDCCAECFCIEIYYLSDVEAEVARFTTQNRARL